MITSGEKCKLILKMQRNEQDRREAARIGPRTTKDPASVDYAWQTIALLRSEYQSSQVLMEKY
jgi:hypothetical protein